LTGPAPSRSVIDSLSAVHAGGAPEVETRMAAKWYVLVRGIPIWKDL
jgi:hypothetical protein